LPVFKGLTSKGRRGQGDEGKVKGRGGGGKGPPKSFGWLPCGAASNILTAALYFGN